MPSTLLPITTPPADRGWAWTGGGTTAQFMCPPPPPPPPCPSAPLLPLRLQQDSWDAFLSLHASTLRSAAGVSQGFCSHCVHSRSMPASEEVPLQAKPSYITLRYKSSTSGQAKLCYATNPLCKDKPSHPAAGYSALRTTPPAKGLVLPCHAMNYARLDQATTRTHYTRSGQATLCYSMYLLHQINPSYTEAHHTPAECFLFLSTSPFPSNLNKVFFLVSQPALVPSFCSLG
ncbi:uncharacterized protein LOC115433913 [Sphaeramia orbicularis]|uniref:uncharacterized protein LOC115433913 n=1 Tax=Sphaeramia orbicularis TaxID=375764 RepID=UPI00118073E5|nr:uncharacterized protein LOC115433913 [Sphaeramia orbicularis]